MSLYAYVNKDGFITLTSGVVFENFKDYQFLIDLVKDPIPKDLELPKWDGSKWVESENIQNLKNLTLSQIKQEASRLIQEVAPSYKQTNWILDNKLDDPDVQDKLKEIKRIREKSNELEKSLNKKKSVNAVKNFEIDFSE